MKKVLLTFLVSFFSFVFFSCGGGGSDGDSNFEMKTPEEVFEDIPVKPPVEKCKYCIPEGSLFTCSEIESALEFLNNIRAEVGVSPLEWDCKLAEEAQKWAEYLAEKGLFEHEEGSPYGENLFLMFGKLPSLLDALKSWYEEKKFFNPDLPNWCEGGECFHYTQLIWKDTKKIGCGIAKYKDMEGYVIVCKFDPPGNILDQMPF
ncbi:MAG: hypothetical protein GXO21_07525 [Aquificae bacterium]|nr:hypothetical protein [Aquificota bacterium]